ncbi:DUF7691 family protein [Streptomyces spiramyceticus]|uniref:DUF7691 family protein n=1 Tax=Streptomyces spiramyceticus TaxID=299717 RepID=UPI00237A9F37|nr:hypothetical protein [Streptomyces spiramyceticus]
MAITSHNIDYSTADKADVQAYLGSNGNLTSDQRRRLDGMRKDALGPSGRSRPPGVDWGLSIPDALGHLIDGHTDSNAECVGNAYNAVLMRAIRGSPVRGQGKGSWSGAAGYVRLVSERGGVSGSVRKRSVSARSPSCPAAAARAERAIERVDPVKPIRMWENW